MLYRRMIEAERRRSAPLGSHALAAIKAGSKGQARRWALAAREAGLERVIRRLIHSAAGERAALRRDEARSARHQRALCFYRVHALRYRDAA
jgi:hypothetical protein